MADHPHERQGATKPPRAVPSVSGVLPGGALFEMVYRPGDARSAFVVWEHGAWRVESGLRIAPLRELVPYSPNNNLIRNGVVLFPSEPEDYGSDEELIAEIQNFIHSYVDVSPLFEK